MKNLRTFWQTSALAAGLVLFQACTHDIPKPERPAPTAAVAPVSTVADEGVVLLRRLKRPASADTTNHKTGLVVARNDGSCTQIVDVYYNIYTGEVIDEVVVETRCPGQQGPTGGGGGDGGSGGGGGGTGPGTGPSQGQEVISQLPPCATKVLADLLAAVGDATGDNLLAAVLNTIQHPNANMTLKFVSGTLASNVAGNCRFDPAAYRQNGTNSYIITINSSYLSGSTATDMFLAQAMLHEILHAALMDWARSNGQATNGVSFDDLMHQIMASQGLTDGDGQGQHDAMSLLVGQLGDALYYYGSSQVFSNSPAAQHNQVLTPNYCKYLCWNGLQNTVGFNWAVNHTPGFLDQYNAIRNAELSGDWGAAAGGSVQYYATGVMPCH